MSISRLLIANRGEIAARIVRVCQALGIESVLAVSKADEESLAAKLADRVVCIGPARATDSYLKVDAILAAAIGTGSDALHPGYGFLAEDPELAEACQANGIAFVGPQGKVIRTMGNKLTARELAGRCGIPLLPGSGPVKQLSDAAADIGAIGFPMLVKAAQGGGGRGIRIVQAPSDLHDAFESATAESRAAFGEGNVYLERYVTNARHIEVQVFGDHYGNLLYLGDRECSLQRRYQKVVEEAPATLISTRARDSLRDSALVLANAIGYENAGTVEFLYDLDRHEYYFLEMNTRIQVEHPVTEAVTGLDLVQMQIEVAGGEPLGLQQSEVCFNGHAIECRVTAESPDRGFAPSPGVISRWHPPSIQSSRLDSHCYSGYAVSSYYDSLLAKLITFGNDRTEAIARMKAALGEFLVSGIDTNIHFLSLLMEEPDFQRGQFNTRWLESHFGGAVSSEAAV